MDCRPALKMKLAFFAAMHTVAYLEPKMVEEDDNGAIQIDHHFLLPWHDLFAR
jgi:hypothetical protein